MKYEVLADGPVLWLLIPNYVLFKQVQRTGTFGEKKLFHIKNIEIVTVK